MPKECDFIKELYERLFRAVALLFSAFLLILFLLSSISLAAEAERLDSLKASQQELIEENRYLKAELEKRYSLQNIERYAREKLGMQPCSPQQIVYIDAPGEG